ncbi:MAG: hypothetical protein J6V50_02965 [Clostridia bacterium]|nr:hypothetical protein [Clostridia bacterium]
MTKLPVDIIYYKTASDFELEFNLKGCCNMLLFNDKIDDRKAFVTALARDVNRSRVIIIVSDLYGDKNGAETVSAAIGYKYVPLDKAAHKIKSDEDIYVPNGALPLVTKSGLFGGCIIECGKQSIIIVTSDRALRHEIMRSYIHQYVFDIHQVELYNERLRHEKSNNPVIDNSNILTNARKEMTGEIPTVPNPAEAADDNDSPAEAESVEQSIPVEAAHGITLPTVEKADDENVANEDAFVDSKADETNGVSEEDTASAPSKENASEKEDSDTVTPVIEVSGPNLSQTDGFEIPKEVLEELDQNRNNKINRRIMRRRKGGNIALLIIAILLLLGFGLLAYFLVYLPIISGEMPNDLKEIMEAIL